MTFNLYVGAASSAAIVLLCLHSIPVYSCGDLLCLTWYIASAVQTDITGIIPGTSKALERAVIEKVGAGKHSRSPCALCKLFRRMQAHVLNIFLLLITASAPFALERNIVAVRRDFYPVPHGDVWSASHTRRLWK